MEQACRIRKAEARDLDTIFSFICHLEETSFPREPFEEVYGENIENPDYEYLVAVNETDEVIGFLSCHGQKLLHHAGMVFEIQELYVARHHRGSGTGRLLMKALEERLNKIKYKSLEVTTNLMRTDARKFYTKLGFVATHQKLVTIL